MTFEEIELHRINMVNTDGTFSIDNRKKLMKMIDTYVDENNYSEEDLRKIQYVFYSYCNSGVKEELISKENSNNSFKENNVKFKDKVGSLDYTNVHKKLMLLDKKRKTSLWSDRALFPFNFYEETRQFLKENNYNTRKLEETCWNHLYKHCSLDLAISEKSEDLIEKIKNVCPNHLKNLDWSKLSMDSHLLVLLAIEYEHDFNQKQINDYFLLIKPNVESQIQKNMEHFALILSNSSFFKSNVTKWKDLKDGLGKNFNISMKGIKEYNEDMTVMQKFIFLLSEYPLVKHDNLKNKVEKKDKMNYFGKAFLNKEEELEYLKIKEQRSLQTKTKKTKI